jgi:hypothetical protein
MRPKVTNFAALRFHLFYQASMNTNILLPHLTLSLRSVHEFHWLALCPISDKISALICRKRR